VDGTERNVEHFIMLRVLSTQSANKSAPFAPGDAHRFHFATQPIFRELALEEPPTLAVRPTTTRTTVANGARVLPHRGQPLGVGPDQFLQPQR